MRTLLHAPVLSLVPILALGLFARPVADGPRFAPKEGASVQRTLEMNGTRDLKSVRLKVGEQEQEIPGATMHQTSSWKHVVVDEFRGVAADRVTKLARTYETLEKSRSETTPGKDGEDRTVESSETCDLVGKTVLFTWDGEKGAYAAKFESEGADDDLLADLVAPMDYQGFLPADGTEEGHKWKGDFDELRGALIRPGGDLPFHGEKAPLPLDKRARAAMWDSMKGEIELERGATTTEDGVTRTAIRFTGKYTSKTSQNREEDEQGPDVLSLEVEQEFEGELVWDHTAARAHALTWTSRGALTVRTESPVKTRDGGDAVLEQTMSLEDEAEYKVTFAAP